MRKLYLLLGALTLSLLLQHSASAQSTFINMGSDEYRLVDRLETFTGELDPYLNTSQKPMSRKEMVGFLNEVQRASATRNFFTSKVDQYNIARAISISGEWYSDASGMDGSKDSKRPILKYFYKKQADLLHVHTDNFFLAVNPVLYLQAGYEMDQGLKTINTRGLELRGRIADRVGFYTMLADNQEKALSYIDDWAVAHNIQYPGVDYSIKKGDNYDMFLGRGYFTFSIVPDKIGVTFGYDKHFIGNGIRSLVLGNNTAPSTFLKLQSHWGKWYYENLFTELIDNNTSYGNDLLLPKKYAVIHQLQYLPTKWLSIGVFESTMMGKKSGIPLEMLVPVIGFQSASKGLGSNHNNVAWGLNFKALALRTMQFYGQAFFDKINMGGSGNWQNQFGLQFGARYFNVAQISNLDLQVEGNIVRPFTYMAQDSMDHSFTHYNQPLAHPLFNNFAEGIVQLGYQPIPKLHINAKAVYSLKGEDSSATQNLGSNQFKAAYTRSNGDSYRFLNGNKTRGLYTNLHVAYELKPNIYLEAGGTYFKRGNDAVGLPNSTFVYGALRCNIPRKEYDFH